MPSKREVEYSMDLEDKTEKELKKAEKNWKALGSAVKKVSAGIAIAAAAGFAATIRSIDKLDKTAKAAERTGFGATKLQELRFAADQTGVAVGVLDGALGRFTKRLGLARKGTGAASLTYRQLGIDLSKTNEEVFDQVVDTIADMDDQTNRLAITTRLFGDDAQGLELTLRGGTAGLADYAQKAHDLGLVFSDNLLRSAEDAGDQLSIMKQVLDAQFTRAFIELAPAVTTVGNAFAEAAPHIASFFNGLLQGQEKWSTNTLRTQIAVIDGQIDHLTSKLEEVAGESPVIDIGFGVIINPFKALTDLVSEGTDDIVEDLKRLVAERDKLTGLLEKREKDDFLRGLEISAGKMVGTILDLTEAVDANKLFNPDAKKTDKTITLFKGQLAAMGKTLAMLDLTTLAEQTLWETQKGRYKDLSGNQKQELIDAAERIDVRNAEIEQLQEEVKAREEQAKATIKAEEEVARLNRDLESQADRWRDILDPSRTVARQFEELVILLDAGKLSATEYAAAIEHVVESAQDNELAKFWESLGDTMASAFEDAILSVKSLSDVVKALEKDILRMVTRRLVTEPLSEMITSFIPKFFHDGGLVSSAGSPGSGVSPSIFMGARRYHDGGIPGLRGNEVPAILEEDEEVITRRDPRHRLNGGRSLTVNNNFSISSPTSKETQQQIAAKAGASINRAIRRGS